MTDSSTPQPPQPGFRTDPQAVKREGASFLAAMRDLSFTENVTLRFAKALYVLGIVANALAWIGGTLAMFGLATATASSYFDDGAGAMYGAAIMSLLFGWIPALLNVVVLRVLIEFVVANVSTAQNTARLVAALERNS